MYIREPINSYTIPYNNCDYQGGKFFKFSNCNFNFDSTSLTHPLTIINQFVLPIRGLGVMCVCMSLSAHDCSLNLNA